MSNFCGREHKESSNSHYQNGGVEGSLVPYLRFSHLTTLVEKCGEGSLSIKDTESLWNACGAGTENVSWVPRPSQLFDRYEL